MKRTDTGTCHPQCGRLLGQWKSLKQSPFQELESMLAAGFKQATASSMVIIGSLLHALPQAWLLKDIRASNGWIYGFKSDTLLCTKLYLGNLQSLDPSTVKVWRKEQQLKIIESYEPQHIYNADERGLCCMLAHNLQCWQEFQGDGDSCVKSAMSVGLMNFHHQLLGRVKSLIALKMSECCPQNIQ